MMKKALGYLALVGLVLALAACGASKYGDIKAAMGKITSATESFVANVDKAKDAKAVAAALKGYIESMKAEQVSFKGLMDKYPELKDAKDPPKELKEDYDKMSAITQKLMEAMTKIQTYAEDPDVAAEFQKMAELQLQ